MKKRSAKSAALLVDALHVARREAAAPLPVAERRAVHLVSDQVAPVKAARRRPLRATLQALAVAQAVPLVRGQVDEVVAVRRLGTSVAAVPIGLEHPPRVLQKRAVQRHLVDRVHAALIRHPVAVVVL